MENTPNRRNRAVSFTVHLGSPEEISIPSISQPNSSQSQVDVLQEEKINTIQAFIRELITLVSTIKSNPDDLASKNRCTTVLSTISQMIEDEETEYMSNPVRCPLIMARHVDELVGKLSNITIETLFREGLEQTFLEWMVEGYPFLNIQIQIARLYCILGQTQPQLVEDLCTLMPNIIEDLTKLVISSPHRELRLYLTGFLGLALNDRKGHTNSDTAVCTVVEEETENNQTTTTANTSTSSLQPKKERLSKVLCERIRNDHSELEPSLELEYYLRCLSFIGEYQDTLAPVLDLGILDIILGLLSSKQTTDIIKFYCLELCSRLMSHKQFASRFANSNGINLLLDLYTNSTRPLFIAPSIAWCLSGVASMSSVMERVLRTMPDASKKLVNFVLNLLRGEQDIARKNALYFFAHAFAFPAILYEFDSRDGCKYLLDMLNNPVSSQRTIAIVNLVKHTVRTLRDYFRAHVALSAHLVRTTRELLADNRSTFKRLPLHKPISIDLTSTEKNIEVLSSKDAVAFLEKTRWRPVEELLQYRTDSVSSGICLLFGVVKASSKADFNLTNAQETTALALQVLSYASLLPISYSQICEIPVTLPRHYFRGPDVTPVNNTTSTSDSNVNNHNNDADQANNQEQQQHEDDEDDDEEDDVSSDFNDHSGFAFGLEETGISILLRVASTNDNFHDFYPRAAIASLKTLVHCVCPRWVGHDQRQARRLARDNNAVMVLLALLNYKEKPANADPIRFFACDALYGLSHDEEVADILTALNVDRVLSEIANSEVIVAENRHYHDKLKAKALALLKNISSGAHQEEIAIAADAAARKIARDAIVRNSNVQWNQRELISIIHDHLEKQGYSNAAKVLATEANLFPLPVVPKHSQPNRLFTWPSKGYRRKFRLRKKMLGFNSKRSISISSSNSAVTPSTTDKRKVKFVDQHQDEQADTNTKRKLKVVNSEVDESPMKKMKMSSFPLPPASAPDFEIGPSQHPTLLEKIVREHLRHQHQTCRNPVTTPAPFSLLDSKSHSCPEVKPSTIFKDPARRIMERQLLPPFGGPLGKEYTTKSIHRNAKWVRAFGVGSDADITTASFRELAGYDDQLALGYINGVVMLFNAWSGSHLHSLDLGQFLMGEDEDEDNLALSGLAFNKNTFITNLEAKRSTVVWKLVDDTEALVSFQIPDCKGTIMDGDRIATFVRNHRISSTVSSSGVAMYNLETGDQVVNFFPLQGYSSNGYDHTNLCMSAGGTLICHDGVLWDARRSQRPIHKFDKLSNFGWGSIHPNGLQLLLNKDVWDLRTYRIVHSCSNALNSSTFQFDPLGDVIYSFHDASTEGPARSSFKSSIVVTDGADYSNIASIDMNSENRSVEKNIYDLAIHPNGGYFAAVVANNNANDFPDCRLYEIGTPADQDSDNEVAILDEAVRSGSEDDSDEDGDGDEDDDFDGHHQIFHHHHHHGGGGRNANFGEAILRAIDLMQNRNSEFSDDEDEEDEENDEDDEMIEFPSDYEYDEDDPDDDDDVYVEL